MFGKKTADLDHSKFGQGLIKDWIYDAENDLYTDPSGQKWTKYTEPEPDPEPGPGEGGGDQEQDPEPGPEEGDGEQEQDPENNGQGPEA